MFCESFTVLYQMGVNPPSDIASGRIAEMRRRSMSCIAWRASRSKNAEAFLKGMKNDLAFIIDTNLFLYEHQSTYNPNMPLRDLLYISAEYQKIVDHKSLYSSVLQKIPAPYFIVFYNGTEKEEDRWENSLSEAYENLTGEPKLELKVITLNNCASHSRYFSDELDALSFWK